MSDPYNDLLHSAMRQKYEMIERDPRDEKWAEWHMHPDTIALMERQAPNYLPTDFERATALASMPRRLFGYPVRPDKKVPVDEVKLVCETELDAAIRHQRNMGVHGTVINVYKPEPLIFPDPPKPPTVKALVKHWIKKARKR